MIHIFTLIQLLALATLWGLKTNPTVGILFPVLIPPLLVSFRFALKRWFSESEREALDAAEEERDEIANDVLGRDLHAQIGEGSLGPTHLFSA